VDKSVGDETNVQLYEVRSGKVCAEYLVPMRFIENIALAPEGRLAAIKGTVKNVDGEVRVFDFFTRKIRPIPNNFCGVKRACLNVPPITFSSDAKRLAVSLPDNSVQIADPLTGPFVLALVGHGDASRKGAPITTPQNGASTRRIAPGPVRPARDQVPPGPRPARDRLTLMALQTPAERLESEIHAPGRGAHQRVL